MNVDNAERHTEAAAQAMQRLAESGYTLEDDGTLDTVIGCRHCDWTGRYHPEICSLDGISDGGEEYTDEEMDYMRVMEAYEMASEEHWHWYA